jgi:GH18 family chitinase
VTAAVNYWLSGGMPASKLIVGLASYGRSWTLSRSTSTGMGAPATGAGAQGPVTLEAGFLA